MYTPPFEITPSIINLISEISEKIGSLTIKKDLKLRKISKIKTLVGTLKIEGIDADEDIILIKKVISSRGLNVQIAEDVSKCVMITH